MIHVAPSMIANSSYCLFHDDKEWAELADINGFFFFKDLSSNYVILFIQARFELFLFFSYQSYFEQFAASTVQISKIDRAASQPHRMESRKKH